MTGPDRGKFISIHGIDGAGKTETAGRVSDLLNSKGITAINYDVYKESLHNPYTKNKEQVLENESLEDQMAKYLVSMMYHGDNIEKLLAQGYHVVKSRYLDDIKAHFSHLGISDERMAELLKKFPMVQPDLRIILQVDEEERKRRIMSRDIVTQQDLEVKAPGSRAYYFEDYLVKTFSDLPKRTFASINTSSLNVDQVAQKVIEHLLDQQQ